MSTHKKNPEYEHMKTKAPGILAEMAHMLVVWRKMGFHVPRGVKNVFEFTWEELGVSLPRKSFSGIYCPIVRISQYEDISPPSTTTSRVQRPGVTISGIKPTYVCPSTEDQQQMLLRFQQRSVHLLSELLKMKMKIMIDAVAGSSAEDIVRRLLEGGQQLNPKNQEEAADLLTKDGRKKGGRAVPPVMSAIPINSTTQLIQQVSYSCLCFSLALKDSKQRAAENPFMALDRPARHGATKHKTNQDQSSYDERLDPCPQAREKLREICRQEEKALYKTKGYTRPLTLRHYPTLTKTPSASLKKVSSPTAVPEPKPRKKSKKFHYAFPDGTSFILYVEQVSLWCSEETRVAPEPTTLLMTQEGGTIRDQTGVLTHEWKWHSKQQILQSLDFQINEQVKLKVLGLHSMTLSFSSHNETITISLSSEGCPHESKLEKRIFAKTNEIEDEGQWTRILADSKRRFERIVKQFVNAVLLTAGICCIDYPLSESSKQVRFKTKEPSLAQAWERKLLEESAAVLKAEGKPRARMPVMRAPVFYRTIRKKPKVPSRDKAEADKEIKLSGTWATSPADCPIVLRQIMAKEDDVVGCKCVVKIPSITDLEFEKFVAAPRQPHQILVICVLSSKNPNYSPFFEWSLEKIYIEMQHGRPSPCVQCKHDPYRFLKYDLDNPVNKNPPLLIQKHGVIPGMVVMYSGGKPLFGGCVFNGYSYSKKDFLKQVNQAYLDCKMGHFLPQSFKFSSPGVLGVGSLKVQATLAKPGFAVQSSTSENKRGSISENKRGSISVTQSRMKESLFEEELSVDEMKEKGEKPKRVTSGRRRSKK